MRANRLEDAPRLGASRIATLCKLCGSQASIFDAVDFNKHCSIYPLSYGTSGVSVSYFRCLSCDCIFTEFFDDWTTEDFSNYVYNDQYVMVDPEYLGVRPINTAKDMRHIFAGLEDRRILDYGSGGGHFAEAMSSYGFSNIESYDPFSNPTVPEGKFDIVTAFEVIEHSIDPVRTLAEMFGFLKSDGCIVFGQTLQPDDIDQIRGHWWYLAPRNGHATTYNHHSFMKYAESRGLTFFETSGLYGLASSAEGIDVLRRFGRRCSRVSLTADQADGGFSHHEKLPSGGSFCWTASSLVSWNQFSLPDGVNFIEIPFVDSIGEAFLKDCVIRVDGEPLVTKMRDQKLTARIDRGGVVSIELVTPLGSRPIDLGRGPDDRVVGVAVVASQ